MPLYYFHLRGRERVADRRGLNLVDDNAAQREAERIAAALQRSRGHVWSVLVTNQWGHHVTQIPEPLRAKGSRDGPPLPAALKGVVFRLDLDVPEVVTSRITARDSRT